MKCTLFIFLTAAATCLAQPYTNNFNATPPLGGADPGGVSPGLWYADRKAPATFQATIFNGRTALDIGVNAGDYDPNNAFYNTQGRKYYLTGASQGSFVSAQLYIPTSWENTPVAPGMWLTAYDNNNAPSGFPIIGFFSDGAGSSYFRVWDDSTGYVNLLSTPIQWDAWNTFTISFTGAGFVYDINGTDVYTDTGAVGSTSIANVMFESKNFGVSYDAYWTQLVTPSSTEPIPEPGPITLLVLGFSLFLGITGLRDAKDHLKKR